MYTVDVTEIAEKARSFFTLQTRKDGSKFWSAPDKPEWVQSMCRDAHNGMFPDDYKYEYIVDALDYLSDPSNDPDEYNPDADVYTKDLTDWLGSHADRPGYVDQAREDGLIVADTDTVTQLAIGQIEERREVFGEVLAYLQEMAKGG
jgi:hypothetical protein